MNQKISTASIPLRLISGLLFLVILGTALMSLPIAAENPLSFRQALFTAVSAITCTGLSIIVPSVDLSFWGQVFLLLLIQIGGIGFMTFAVLIFRLLGLQITMVNRIALRDTFGIPRTAAIFEFMRQVITIVLSIEAGGAVLLWIHWRAIMGNTQALWYAVFHSISAFCNAGFDLFNGMSAYPEGIPNDTISLTIMSGLIIAGCIGFPVIANLINYRSEGRLTLHTRLTLITTAILTILGSLLFFLSEGLPGGILSSEPLPHRIALVIYQIISTRTAGFAGFADFQLISPAGRLLLILLMFIGSAPASMGGGMKTGTLITLIFTLRSYIYGDNNIMIQRRTLSWDIARRAIAVLLISLLVVSSVTWLILATHPTNLEIALFEVVSAFATCGYTMSLTSQLNSFGLTLIMFTMFWGKLGALTVAAALVGKRQITLVTYPEENILIG